MRHQCSLTDLFVNYILYIHALDKVLTELTDMLCDGTTVASEQTNEEESFEALKPTTPSF